MYCIIACIISQMSPKQNNLSLDKELKVIHKLETDVKQVDVCKNLSFFFWLRHSTGKREKAIKGKMK